MKRLTTTISALALLVIVPLLPGPIQGNAHTFVQVGPEAASLPRGEIVRSVICTQVPGQSYALYLPARYRPDQAWPIIYAFDPAARGYLPVEHYREAAEKYGIIIAGSNNSRNGPWVDNFTAAAAMWADTHQRFALNSSRVYVTGFSGGARVACEVASMPRYRVAGVIAHGAGFRQGHEPTPDLPFSFFGIVGNEDFNFLELQELDRTLDDLGIPNHIAVFDGPHNWAPEAVCTEAVEWLELQALRSGIREKDLGLLDTLYQKRLLAAEEYEKAGQFYEAHHSYTALAQDFQGLRAVQEIEDKRDQLAVSRAVRRRLKIERRLLKQEDNALNAIGGNFAAIVDPARRVAAIESIVSTAKHYQRLVRKKREPHELHLAARVLNYINNLAFTEGSAYLNMKYYPEAVAVLEMWAAINPDWPEPFYNLAGAYTLMGDTDKALAALQAAIDRGFDDVAHIEANPRLFLLRKERAYRQMVAELRQKR
ncbi:MAG: hypothetical protein ACETWG_03760 [Candidatus Neomarinimicrobiota bacterium]